MHTTERPWRLPSIRGGASIASGASNPAARCWPKLAPLADGRVDVVRAGWWSATTELQLYDPGTERGSVDPSAGWSDEVERCRFIDAAAWLSDHVDAADEVWAKVNVEGAEVEVLEHLLATGTIGLIDHLVVHFDVETVLGQVEAADALRQSLRDAGVAFQEPHEVMFGRTIQAKTATWLAWTMGDRSTFYVRKGVHLLRAVAFRLRRRVRSVRLRSGSST